ncbi:cohesin domain-containing protein [Haloarchaeobius amylolyticus]|uniref:cohesin domain-containing protein n=1 Tax=Haloarchaeobius amylolyticus TaxID=1198296 RepID=UPI0022712042|nr:cohesin domain-containing protein [Haloarchaeobius amylolyticus]
MTTTRLTDPRTVLLAACCLALAVSPTTIAAADAEPNATLSLSTAEVANDADTTTVTLAATGEDVAGYQANVTFDPSVVRVTEVSGADFPDPVVNVNNEEGWVFLTQSRASGSADPALARITFEAVGSDASTRLRFVEDDTLVNDGDGEHVGTSLDPGGVAVGESQVGAMADGAGTDGEGSAPDDGGSSGDTTGAGDGAASSDSALLPESATQPVLVAGAGLVLLAGIAIGRRSS